MKKTTTADGRPLCKQCGQVAESGIRGGRRESRAGKGERGKKDASETSACYSLMRGKPEQRSVLCLCRPEANRRAPPKRLAPNRADERYSNCSPRQTRFHMAPAAGARQLQAHEVAAPGGWLQHAHARTHSQKHTRTHKRAQTLMRAHARARTHTHTHTDTHFEGIARC